MQRNKERLHLHFYEVNGSERTHTISRLVPSSLFFLIPIASPFHGDISPSPSARAQPLSRTREITRKLAPFGSTSSHTPFSVLFFNSPAQELRSHLRNDSLLVGIKPVAAYEHRHRVRVNKERRRGALRWHPLTSSFL